MRISASAPRYWIDIKHMVVSVYPVRHPFIIIDTRATIDVFQPTPFGIVSILDAFYIRDEINLCTTLRQPRLW